MRRQDLSASDCFNWGLSLMERERHLEGIGWMRRALKRDPALYQAYFCIAVSYLETNAPIDSVNANLNRCFEYNPDYEPALNLKALIESKGN
jgi:hypothetical protein